MRRYTVSALNDEIGLVLGGRYTDVLVEGEVGQLSTPSSGHCYLTLRDRDACLAAVCWRGTWRQMRYRPKVGERVVCRGRLSVYSVKGTYQLYVNQIAPAGAGDLAREIEARKARLAADGLLDPERKRPLPRFPRHVGVATSLTGAALQDFLKVSRQRWPAARILVAGCVVQGDEAPASVIRAVELLIEDGRSEVIVVTRGGGSQEDLLAFHDEQLARYLAASPIPIVSAVGHQVDTTIADLVADAVAPTPSAAALLVLPDGPALRQRVDEAAVALEGAVVRNVRRSRERVGHLEARLRHPGDRIGDLRRREGDLHERLLAGIVRHLERHRAGVRLLEQRVPPAVRVVVQDRRRRLESAAGRLDALSPLAVLGRGYAIVRGPGGVLRDPAEVVRGDALTVRVEKGEIEAVVR